LGDFRTTELKPQREQSGADERLVFTERAFDALETESSIPSDYLTGRIFQFSEYGNWGEVAQWAASMFPDIQPSAALREVARALDGAGTPAARAAAALHWVQNEVRYFSVSIGENSHRPQQPDTVLSRRYGDCKDKSYLLVSLLRLLGVEARPILVSAQAPKLPARMLPSPKWFDHVIVKITIDGRDYFVDPTQTGQTESLAGLPVALAGGMGLVVDPKSAGLLVIPEESGVVPQLEIQEELKLASFEAPAELISRRYYSGKYAGWARRVYTGSALTNLKRLALEPYEKTYPGIKLLEGPKYVDEAGRFVVTSRFELPKPVDSKEKIYSVAYDSKVMEGTLGIPDKLVRNYPFAPSAGRYSARYRMRLHWPAAVRNGNEQASKSLDTAQFSAREDLILRGSTLDYLLDYKVKADRVEAADLPEMQRRAKELTQLAQGSFRINADSLSSNETLPLTLRQIASLGMQQQLEYYRGALRGMPLAEIRSDRLCRYLAVLYLQDDWTMESGKGDLKFMDNQLPDLLSRPEITPCVGFVHFVRGRFKDSIASYRQGKPAGSSSIQPMLAWAQMLSGSTSEAAATMEAYYNARKKEGVATTGDVADLAAMSLRAGRPLPGDLAALADPDPSAQWPRPVLALYAGQLSAEQVVAIAGKLPRDASAHALNDAWFHIGQLRLANGDLAGAQAAFRWFAHQGLTSTPYYQIARGELSALDGGADFKEAMDAYRRDDRRSGLALLQRAAAGGDPAAEFELAVVHHTGTGLPPNLALARDWYGKAALKGHLQAQRELAHLLGKVEGRPWLLKSAQGGNGDALLDLAVIHVKGDGVPQDLQKGFDYALQAAESGQVKAQAFVASAYGLGVPVPSNGIAAIYWAKRASANELSEIATTYDWLMVENATKLDFLSVPYGKWDSGAGRAVTALKMTGNPGQAAISNYFVAFLSQYGFGLPKDEPLARKLFREAGTAGIANAWYYLAMMNRDGRGGDANAQMAAEQLGIAADAGMPQAQYMLGRLFLSGKGVAADGAAAARWFGLAASQGHVDAMNELGDLYETGNGVKQDLKRAYELYVDAANGGEAMGFYSLGSLLEKGRYLKQDAMLAYTYYFIAARLNPSTYKWEAVNRMFKKLREEDVSKAKQMAVEWKAGQPLPGLNEASVSPAGRE
jgi:TPR repeat protein/transglutaminase-like putative cysteine protease